MTLRLAVDAGPFVGMPVTVLATLTDADGGPVPNGSVTMLTSWGSLRFVDGVVTRRGRGLAALTDGSGIARASLLPPTTEDLQDDELAALNATLSRIDPAAERPADAADALADLAREYRWEVNGAFRQAVDVLFRDLRQGVLDTVHAYDFQAAWPLVSVVVTAHAGQGSPGDEASSTAVLEVELRDWLGAFLQSYEQHVTTDGGVDERLADITRLGGDAGNLLANAYDRVRDFVQGERGMVGAHIAPVVADRSLRRFVDAAAPNLPVETQVQLYPAANATAAAVASSGVDVAGAVTRARIDFGQALSTTVAEVDPAGIKQRLGAVEGELGTTSTALEDVRTQVTASSTAIDDVRSQVAASSSAIDDVRNQLTASSVTLQEVQTQVQANQAQIQANETQLQTFNSRLDTVNQTLNRIDVNEINRIRDRLDNLRIGGPGVAPAVPAAPDVDRLRQEVAALSRRIDELAARLPPPPPIPSP